MSPAAGDPPPWSLPSGLSGKLAGKLDVEGRPRPNVIISAAMCGDTGPLATVKKRVILDRALHQRRSLADGIGVVTGLGAEDGGFEGHQVPCRFSDLLCGHPTVNILRQKRREWAQIHRSLLFSRHDNRSPNHTEPSVQTSRGVGPVGSSFR